MKQRWTLLLLVAIVVTAFAVRLVPYVSSPYPYNVDGYPLVKGAERIIEDGSWSTEDTGSGLEAYNSKMPAFSYLLAEFSMVTGMEPMACIQLLTALLGAACVVLGFALAKRLTGSDAAALGCAAFLAFQGFFVYATVAAWKEGLGMLLMLMAFLLFEGRADPRKRPLLALVLLLLPMTHHLTTLVAYSFVFMAATAEAVARWREDRLGWDWMSCEGATFGVPVAFAYAYYTSVEMEFFSDVNNANDAALLASAVLIGAIVAILLSLPAMSKPWFVFEAKPGRATAALLFDEKSLALLVGYGVLAVNSQITVFPGTHYTSEALIIGIAPLIPVFLLAIAGFNLVRYSSSPAKSVLAAMALAPLFLLVFAMAKSYDPASFFVAYRLLDYLDPFVAVGAGVGLAYLIAAAGRKLGPRADAPAGSVGATSQSSHMSSVKFSRRARGAALALGACFVVLVASTAPMAYDWERVFGISSETKPQQFQAISWADEVGMASLTTDQWNADIAAPYFEMDADQTLPYHLRDGKGYGPEPMLLEEEWKERGAQTPLSGRLPIPAANFDKVVADGNLVYSCGPVGDRVYIVIP